MAQRKGLTEVFDLIKAYARQELVDPLKPAPRWLGVGIAGSFLLVMGSILLLLALLRALQTETGTTFTGNLSWVPYVIAMAAAMVVIFLLVRRINKRSLE